MIANKYEFWVIFRFKYLSMLIIINNSVFIVSILPHKCLIIQRKLLVSFVCAPIKACAKPGSQTGEQPSMWCISPWKSGDDDDVLAGSSEYDSEWIEGGDDGGSGGGGAVAEWSPTGHLCGGLIVLGWRGHDASHIPRNNTRLYY